MSTSTPARLPARVRRAVVRLETAFAGDDQTYAAAMASLSTACADLNTDELELVNAQLASARARVEAAEFTAQVQRALSAGQYRSVRVLPGGVEMLAVSTDDLEQLLVTVPAPLESDSTRVRALVAAARAAVLAGRCVRCGGHLSAQSADQLTVEHSPRCAVSEHAIARARTARR